MTSQDKLFFFITFKIMSRSILRAPILSHLDIAKKYFFIIKASQFFFLRSNFLAEFLLSFLSSYYLC